MTSQTLTHLVSQIYSCLLLIGGLSVLLNSKLWVDYIFSLEKKPYVLMLHSFASLPFILFVLFTHNIWAWSPAVMITLIAWIGLVKTLSLLLFPRWIFKSPLWPSSEEAAIYSLRWRAFVITGLGAFLTFWSVLGKTPEIYQGIVDKLLS